MKSFFIIITVSVCLISSYTFSQVQVQKRVFKSQGLNQNQSRNQIAVPGYHIIDSLKLGGEEGWDYLTVDNAARRLYISRSSRVQVVNLEKKSIVGEIPNTAGVHGIAIDPSSGHGYTSNGRDSSVTVFDLKTLKKITTIKLQARNPDAILFDPASNRVFTFNGGSANASAIDTKTNKVVGTIPLLGKPEFAVTDGEGKIFVNIEDKNLITVIDSRLLKVLHNWRLDSHETDKQKHARMELKVMDSLISTTGEEPSGLAIDRFSHRLFSVCRNKLMLILEAESGNFIDAVSIGEGVDGAAFDPVTKLAFSSNGEGTLTVVNANNPFSYSVLESVTTRRGARTLVLDDKTHRIYTVAAKYGPPPAPTTDRPHPRPTIEPGSVTLYIIGK